MPNLKRYSRARTNGRSKLEINLNRKKSDCVLHCNLQKGMSVTTPWQQHWQGSTYHERKVGEDLKVFKTGKCWQEKADWKEIDVRAVIRMSERKIPRLTLQVQVISPVLRNWTQVGWWMREFERCRSNEGKLEVENEKRETQRSV